MAYLISLFFIVLGIIKRNSRIVFLFVLLIVFLLLGWSLENADYQIYCNKFYNYQSLSSLMEPLYSFIIYLFRLLKLEYYHLVIFQAIVYTLSVYFVCKNTSINNPAFPAALLIIFPLCMDATQKRQTLAMCVGWFAVLLLFSVKRKKKAVLIYIFLCILASMIHISCIFYLFVIFAKLYDTKKVFYASGIVFIALIIIGPLTLKTLGSYFISDVKLTRVYNMDYDEMSQIRTWIRMIFIFLSYFIPYKYAKDVRKMEISVFQEFVYKMNICLLATMPLIIFTNDFYRVQQVAILFNYCAISNWLFQHHNRERFKIKKSNIFFIFITLFFCILNLYLLVLRSTNINTVFRAFFENNTLLN